MTKHYPPVTYFRCRQLWQLPPCMHTHCFVGTMYLDVSGSPPSPDIENSAYCQRLTNPCLSSAVTSVSSYTCRCTFHMYMYLNQYHVLFTRFEPTLYYNVLCVYLTCTLSAMQITLLRRSRVACTQIFSFMWYLQ